jgi:hypothetical protein
MREPVPQTSFCATEAIATLLLKESPTLLSLSHEHILAGVFNRSLAIDLTLPSRLEAELRGRWEGTRRNSLNRIHFEIRIFSSWIF